MDVLTVMDVARWLKFISSSSKTNSRHPLYDVFRNSIKRSVGGPFPAFFDFSDCISCARNNAVIDRDFQNQKKSIWSMSMCILILLLGGGRWAISSILENVMFKRTYLQFLNFNT